jgi:CRP/FNR family cyclic AMP-dependent transcriptional regulator
VLDAYLPLARRLFDQTGVSQRVSDETLESFLGSAVVRRQPVNATLCMRDDPLSDLLFVLEGSLEISMEGSDGRRSIVGYLGPGQWFGLISIIDGKGSVHNARSHTDTVFLQISRAVFLQAISADNGLAMLCLDVLCDRSRTIYDHMAAETLFSLRARVARRLLLMRDQYGRDSEAGIEIDLKLSQDEFSAMLGVTRQSLNRELKALEAAGVISLAYSRIRLRDLDQLNQIAEQPGRYAC